MAFKISLQKRSCRRIYCALVISHKSAILFVNFSTFSLFVELILLFRILIVFRLSVLYSLNEELQVSACDFWCCILQSRDEVYYLIEILSVHALANYLLHIYPWKMWKFGPSKTKKNITYICPCTCKCPSKELILQNQFISIFCEKLHFTRYKCKSWFCRGMYVIRWILNIYM